jgi:hypothetical protein
MRTQGDRRRIALGAMMALFAASSLALLTDFQTGPAWLHWIGSLVALGAALGIVVIAELTWHLAINSATAAGLVRPSFAVPAAEAHSPESPN